MAFVGGLLTFMAIGGFPPFVEDMKVSGGYYSSFIVNRSLWLVISHITKFSLPSMKIRSLNMIGSTDITVLGHM